MTIISCGECNSNMIYLIVGGVSKFVVNLILYFFPDGAVLNKHPFLLGINAGIGMSLAIIPYLLIYKNAKKGKKKLKDNNSYLDDKLRNRISSKIKIEKYIILFLCGFLDFFQKTLVFMFSYSISNNIWIFNIVFLNIFTFMLYKTEIYKHQYLAFGINFISMVLILIKVILTILEGDEKKALYVKFWWFIFIAIIIFSIYAYFLSYIFVNLKKIFYLKFIPVSRILLYYGIIGFILSVILCTFFSVITFGKKIENIHEVKDYICKVINYENQTFIDNAKVYFVENWENSETNEKRNEILISIIQSLLFSIYKYFSYKIIESLNPFHRIFSGSIYYFTEQMIFFLSNLNKIIQDENIYLKLKMYMDLSSDFLSVLTFLIYTEIIEINFCHFNYNLRKNIILRGKNDDSSEYDLDRSTINEDDTTINGVSDYNSNYSISST